MHAVRKPFTRSLLAAAVLTSLGLAACGGGSSNDSPAPVASQDESYVVPAAPAGLGFVEAADAPSGVLAYVDTGETNQRNNPCQVTLETNAGVRVLKGFLDLWEPLTRKVDAGVTLAAANGCDAVVASSWSGVPGTAPDGTVTLAAVHNANIDYVKQVTASRTTEQALAAYMDDRRGKGYSVSDGMGPLTSIWRTGTAQTTTIVAPADPNVAVTKVDEKGNNLGDKTSSALAQAVTFIDSGNIVDGSTEPAKRFFKYARPYRWSNDVSVVPALESAKSTTPATDGGFPSGHTAEAWRDTLPMAYLFPQRYQELITRAMEMGENRVLAGMHSPLDVMGGRIQATAVVAYSLNKTSMDKAATFDLVQNYLMTQTGASDFNALLEKARTPVTTDKANVNYDRFSDYASNKASYTQKLTYSLPKIAANDGKAPTVPKGAEVLIETRLPYLSAAQRRVVLKTTQIDSGYPLANDEEGWGRLNLFAAADGYGAFNGDVDVTMDASLGGFHAIDTWKNNITGAGKLTKLGSGELRLAGANSYSGGSVIEAGRLTALSGSAFGTGDVFLRAGELKGFAGGVLNLGGAYTQVGGTLVLDVASASSAPALQVAGTATLDGGTLRLNLGYTPAAGSSITVLSAGKRQGKFASVIVEGRNVSVSYTATSVSVSFQN